VHQDRGTGKVDPEPQSSAIHVGKEIKSWSQLPKYDLELNSYTIEFTNVLESSRGSEQVACVYGRCVNIVSSSPAEQPFSTHTHHIMSQVWSSFFLSNSQVYMDLRKIKRSSNY